MFGLHGALLAGDPGVGGPTTKSILYGASATMWPDFTYGTGAIDNGVGAVVAGSSYVVSPTITTTYNLTVTNLAGDTSTNPITVNVATVVVAAIAPATRIITEGHNFTFVSSVTGAVDPSINWFVDGIPGGNATVGTITVGGNYTSPMTVGPHTITAGSNANSDVSQSASVSVVLAPTIPVALAATPSAIYYGATSVLSATYANGTATLIGGATNATPSSPVNFTTPVLIATTDYTLTVTNTAGDSVTSPVTVTVSAVTMTPLAPSSKYLSATKTASITGGVVSGAADPSVIWQVNGVTGGNATYGTIDASGNYTAPATVPGNPSITIGCVSNEENSITQIMTINLVNLPVIQTFTVN